MAVQEHECLCKDYHLTSRTLVFPLVFEKLFHLEWRTNHVKGVLLRQFYCIFVKKKMVKEKSAYEPYGLCHSLSRFLYYEASRSISTLPSPDVPSQETKPERSFLVFFLFNQVIKLWLSTSACTINTPRTPTWNYKGNRWRGRKSQLVLIDFSRHNKIWNSLPDSGQIKKNDWQTFRCNVKCNE